MTNDIDKTISGSKVEQLAAGDVDHKKRSLMSKAAVVAPVAMVAMSRPAWGDLTGTKFDCGISGMMSGNVSARPDQPKCNGGFSPGYWGNKNGWCRWSDHHGKTFVGLFGSTSCSGEAFSYANKTLGEVLGPNNAKAAICSGENFVLSNEFEGSLGWHAIAAWLNSKYVPNYVFTTANVVSMVTAVMANGSVILEGVSYNCDELKALLDSTY